MLHEFVGQVKGPPMTFSADELSQCFPRAAVNLFPADVSSRAFEHKQQPTCETSRLVARCLQP